VLDSSRNNIFFSGMSALGSSASAATTTADEYVRLKHELAQTRARTDKKRIEARQLISQRDGLKSDVANESAEVEEKQLILEETLVSIKRLKEQIEVAKGEKDVLMKKIEK
jgi:seryl-tRNA synthetase